MTGLLVAPLLSLLAGLAAARAWWAVGAARERARRVAHEVRGPLTAARLLLDGAVRREELDRSLAGRLSLELRRASLALEDPEADDDRCAERPREVDLAALLRCQIGAWRALGAEHGVAVTLHGPTRGPVLVRADALRLAQATANVVHNAIEHGGGTVEIRMRTAGDRVRVEVSDGGPGLPAPVADLARRARRGQGRRGRGLAISARVLARYGGRISALPSPRGGRVAIELPAVRVAAPADAAR